MPSCHPQSAEPESPNQGTSRRVYKSPTLLCFGRVVGLTMGSDGMGNDGGGGMSGFTGTPGGMGGMGGMG